jgi:hypothetical protein
MEQHRTPTTRATAGRAGNHSTRRSRGHPFAGLDIGRRSDARTHLCCEVGAGGQRGVVPGYRYSRRVGALSAPRRCPDLPRSDWRADSQRDCLGGMARTISAYRLSRVCRGHRRAGGAHAPVLGGVCRSPWSDIGTVARRLIDRATSKGAS